MTSPPLHQVTVLSKPVQSLQQLSLVPCDLPVAADDGDERRDERREEQEIGVGHGGCP